MTSNRLKADARAMRDTEGISYADALRRLLAQPQQAVFVYTFAGRPGELVVDAWGHVLTDTVFDGQAAWISGTCSFKPVELWGADSFVDYPAGADSWCCIEGLRDFHLVTAQVATARREVRPDPRPGTHELHLRVPGDDHIHVARVGHLIHLIDRTVDEQVSLRALARFVFGSGHTTYVDDAAELVWAELDAYNADASFELNLVKVGD